MNNEVEIEISRLDPGLPLPEYQTDGAVAFDITAFEDKLIEPGQVSKIRTGFIFTVPLGYVLMITSRSSGPSKLGLAIPHGIGLLDQDFQGKDDELLIQVHNITKQLVNITKGTRIAQGLIVPIVKAKWKEVPRQSRGKSRGGFGSTGV